MFAVKRNAVIGFNLYCGGGLALAPASPGGGPTPPPPAAAPATAAAAAEVPWAAASRPEVPRTLIGQAAAPRSLIGCGAAPRAALPPGGRPGALWSPEEELDGCEPEPERGPAGDSLPGPPDGLRQDSLELISRYLREAAGESEPGAKKLFPGLLGGPGRPGDAVMEKALETLRRVGNGVMQKHELTFQGMLQKLDIQKEEDLQSVCEVAAHVFSDGVTNWGRVVTLISFGAFVAKHLKSINQEKCISSLARIITDALVSSKREWLMSQGGWDGFVDFFRVEDLEGSIRNILMVFAGVAGLGASLAYMIR
ncbi:induced myeloid leukemia cell differentiation protein Mcl-1 [Falco biarmicus]|uniref:induced myeloid leukemia cell differentiation protein Mcl-1 n=1 Tax=Falco rusticolus TaxID=120794 RepID=UPI001886A493|nr:induced myeloid leukemia cell differentiation protein Mcl-1 [Falco rusticolus]XP_055552726.1 induced myeloid leukemia cell differentiation protein Mcl-1 [Falco cherrug]XP_055647886.1 induced myeloid leukemia cell differentiation protein Mcl-1 [Falco peregrinus]XP_056177974.1 induced myeloid leukemia cell differentiation protein Mcl-1 [Falco biarmicus]